MPIYLVRWGNLSVAIVRARDKTDLDIILDEVGYPGGCEVKEYTGPLYIGLDLDVKYHISGADNSGSKVSYSIDDVSECVEFPRFRLGLDGGDGEWELRRQIAEFAYPNYTKYLDEVETAEEQEPESGLSQAERELMCKDAIRRDLEP